jgi:excisionase family DNA binding protein
MGKNAPADSHLGEEDYLTVSDVAPMLHYSLKRIRDLLRSGDLHGSKVGRKWLIARAEIDRLISTGTVRRLVEGVGLSPATSTAREEYIAEHQRALRRLALELREQLRFPVAALLWLRDAHDRSAGLAGKLAWSRDKSGMIAVRVSLENEPLFDCLVQHSANADVWRRLAEWKLKAGELIVACHGFHKEVREGTDAETKRGKTSDSAREELSPEFWDTIYGDSVYRAEGRTWISDDWYKRESTPKGLVNVRCGSYVLAVAGPVDASALEEKHHKLRAKFSRSDHAKNIVRLQRGMRALEHGISQNLEEMERAGFLNTTCTLCEKMV